MPYFYYVSAVSSPAPSHDLSWDRIRSLLHSPLNHLILRAELLVDLHSQDLDPEIVAEINHIRILVLGLQEDVSANFANARFSHTMHHLAEIVRNLESQLSRIHVSISTLRSRAAFLNVEKDDSDFSSMEKDLERLQEVMERMVFWDLESLGQPRIAIPDSRSKTQALRISKTSGSILLFQYDEESLQLLKRKLERFGFAVRAFRDPRKAWASMSRCEPDLLLVDVTPPDTYGLDFLETVRGETHLHALPTIALCEWRDEEIALRAVALGAEDCLPAAHDSMLLLAKIRSAIERKHLRDRERDYLAKIEEHEKQLHLELSEAASYVQTLLPTPREANPAIAWHFEPSAELGGDAFGYHEIAGGRLALYILDVCGHGVGAALLSVSVMNMLTSGSSRQWDESRPEDVLCALNHAFQMEQQNGLYFTIWYGVYDPTTCELSYCNAGHPAPMLFHPRTSSQPVSLLNGKGPFIGGFCDVDYSVERCRMEPGTRLVLYSDGVHEIFSDSGEQMEFERVVQLLDGIRQLPGAEFVKIARELLGAQQGGRPVEDDYSMLVADF